MKIIGIFLILISGTLIGFYHSFKFIFRRNDLLEMKRAIQVLNSEIKFLSNGIKDALENVKNNVSYPIQSIFFEFEKNINLKKGEELFLIWEESLKKSIKNTYLKKEDFEKFKLIGKYILSYDKNLSLEGFKIILDYIDYSVKEIEKEKMKNMKMYQSIGILSSVGLIILLI